MADNIDVLSARLEVKDSFTSQLNSFINKTAKAESQFEKFINDVDKSARILEKTLDVIDAKINSVTTKITAQTDVMTSKITSSANKIQETQNKVVSNLTSKYTKMGKDVSDIFKTINKDAETLAKSSINLKLGGSTSSKTSNDDSDSKFSSIFGKSVFTGDKTESLFNGVLSGNFTRVLGTLSVIGAGVTGAVKILSTIDNWMQQGYNALNTLSTGLFSVSGLEKDVESASSLETSRIALDTLYGNKELGQQYYKTGISAAQNSTFAETDVVALQKKLAGAKLNYNQQDLQTILGLAALKPEMGVEHVGFSLVDAMMGRTTSLKTNYMIDNKEVQSYLKSLQKTDQTDYTQWKDAFNTKGAVNNKQEYFDLLVNYIQKQTNYGKLAEEYANTFEGQVHRVQGYWEILRADLLGVDRETGNVKPNSLFANVKLGLNDLQSWLKKDTTQGMLNNLGQGLSDASKPVLNAFENLLQKINWTELGDVLKSTGDVIAKIVNQLKDSPAFTELIDKLPKLLETILNSKIIDTMTNVKTGEDLSNGDIGSAANDWIIGKQAKIYNDIGIKTKDNPFDGKNAYGETAQQASSLPFLDKLNSLLGGDKAFLTNANADTYLAQNNNLSDDDKQTVKNAINEEAEKGHDVYNITIGEVKAENDVMDFINKVKGLQSNNK